MDDYGALANVGMRAGRIVSSIDRFRLGWGLDSEVMADALDIAESCNHSVETPAYIVSDGFDRVYRYLVDEGVGAIGKREEVFEISKKVLACESVDILDLEVFRAFYATLAKECLARLPPESS